MNALATVLAALAEHGAPLLLGVTVVLLAGYAAVCMHRSPAQRRRLGILTALGALLYLVFAAAPLPRVTLRSVVRPDAEPASAPPLSADARTVLLLAAMPEIADAPAVAAPVSGAPGFVLPNEAAPVPPPASGPAWWQDVAAWPWSPLLAGAWVAGAAFMLVRTIGGRLRLRALLAACRPVPAPLLRGVELPPGTRVMSTARAVRPFCAGFWRPVVVLPEAMLAPERAAELHAVVRHEVEHVRAGDPRVWSLLAWLAVPLFCHPLFWWLCREVRFCSELLADDAAARCGGRQRYARALIDLAERSGAQVAAAGTVAVFHRPSEFYRRIQMLLARQGPLSTSTPRWRRCAHALSMLFLVGVAASVFGVPAPAQEPARSLKKENAELRATVDSLRDELAAMRAQIHALRDAHAATGAEAAHRAAMVDPLVRLNVNQAPQPVRESLLTPAPHPRGDLALPQDPVRRGGAPMGAGAPAEAPRTGAPDGGVPMLKDVPLAGSLFAPSGDAPGIGAPREYVVKQGDSLERIAKQECGDARRTAEMLALNPDLEPARLRPGQRILLPAGGDPLAGDGPARELPSAYPGQDDARARELLVAKGFGAAQPGGDAAFAPSPSGVAAIGDLTARYLDLVGEIEVQKVTCEETKRLADAGHTSQSDAMRAAVRLRTLEKKLAIAARLIDGEIGATESELQWLERRSADCSPTERMQIDAELHRAKMRLEALRAAKL